MIIELGQSIFIVVFSFLLEDNTIFLLIPFKIVKKNFLFYILNFVTTNSVKLIKDIVALILKM